MFDMAMIDVQSALASSHLAAMQMLEQVEMRQVWAASEAAPQTWTHADLPVMPPWVDYTPYIPFVRHQGAWGCAMFSKAACWDICNNRVCPNSPNLSVNRQLWIQLAQVRVDQVAELLQALNIHPADVNEAAWQQAFGVSGGFKGFSHFVRNPFGESYTRDIGYLRGTGAPSESCELTDTDAVQTPPRESQYELFNYRMKGFTPIKVDANEFRKGLTIGPMRITIQNGKHSVALIGYDDAAQRFKFINSAGDRWNDWTFNAVDGYGYIPYAQLAQHVQGAEIYEFYPPRSVPTATVRLQSQYRQDVYIWLGIEGLPYAKRIWPDGQRSDDSRNLTFTVTLPRGFHWPPGRGNRLFLEVFDCGAHSPGGGTIDFSAAFCEQIYLRHHDQPVNMNAVHMVAPVAFKSHQATRMWLP